MNRTNEGVTIETEANDFVTDDGIFLCGEGEHHGHNLGNVIISSIWCKDFVVSKIESGVLELESSIIVDGSSVNTRPGAQKEKENAKHVDDDQGFCSAMLSCNVLYYT
jgi:hypothetical protein